MHTSMRGGRETVYWRQIECELGFCSVVSLSTVLVEQYAGGPNEDQLAGGREQ